LLWESADDQRSLNRMLDQLDSLSESEVVSENLEEYAENGAAAARTVPPTPFSVLLLSSQFLLS
jgi:hypothetical protein